MSDRWPCELAVRPAALKRQLELLLGRGYVGTTFSEAVTGPPAERTLAVTFDDAFRSVVERAAPVLSDLGIPATVFVPTAFPDREPVLSWAGIEHWVGGEHHDELRTPSWLDLRSLAEAGWEIGSHTRSHPRLTALDDATLAAELTESREACEHHLGRACTSLAYPYGDVDDRVVAAVAAAGYTAAAALPARPRQRGALEWPRVGVWRDDWLGRYRLKVSPRVRRLRAA
ncbi:MAG: polysaccharide deacetylase family protein [Thermoleophilaceae bacterium]